jgi:hypothetical protein
MHHWPLSRTCNGSDMAGKRHLLGGLNFGYVSDRHNNTASAVHLQRGFLRVPPGVYFYGDLSISVWLKLCTHQPWVRLLDFGNDHNTDNLFFSTVNNSGHNSLALVSYHSLTKQSAFVSTVTDLELHRWYHVVVTLQSQLASIFIDGVLVQQSSQDAVLKPRNVPRTYNFIGRRNAHSGDDEYAQAVLDEFKIYQGALTPRQVNDEFLLPATMVNDIPIRGI